MKSLSSWLVATATVLSLAACGKQTPLQLQEPAVKPNFYASYAEDRITLSFPPGVNTLSMQQKDYINRFVSHYKGAKHTAIYVSLLTPPEREDIGTIPRHQPDVVGLTAAVAAQVDTNGVRPRMMKEVDTFGQPHVTEARARKAMIDSAIGSQGADVSFLAPEASDLQRSTKIAVVAREYEVEAANCIQQGHHQWGGSRHITQGIMTGCATHKNMLAQIKDHSILIHGEEMDPEYYSAFSVLQLRKAQDAQFDAEFQKAKAGVSGNFSDQ